MTQTQPQPGDWAVVQEPTSPVEKMQRLIRGSSPRYRKYVHAFMLVSLTPFEIVEAMPSRMQRVAFHYDPDTVYWSNGVFHPTETQRRLIVASANHDADIRVDYSFLDYGAIGLHSWGIATPQLMHYIAYTGHRICSQSVDQQCLDGGEHLFDDNRLPGYVAPMHLAERIAAP